MTSLITPAGAGSKAPRVRADVLARVLQGLKEIDPAVLPGVWVTFSDNGGVQVFMHDHPVDQVTEMTQLLGLPDRPILCWHLGDGSVGLDYHQRHGLQGGLGLTWFTDPATAEQATRVTKATGVTVADQVSGTSE